MRREILCSILFVLATCRAYSQAPVIHSYPHPTDTPPEILPPFDTLEEQGRYLAVKEFMRHPRPLSPVGDFTLWQWATRSPRTPTSSWNAAPRFPAKKP
jgi:hypothetical protein